MMREFDLLRGRSSASHLAGAGHEISLAAWQAAMEALKTSTQAVEAARKERVAEPVDRVIDGARALLALRDLEELIQRGFAEIGSGAEILQAAEGLLSTAAFASAEADIAGSVMKSAEEVAEHDGTGEDASAAAELLLRARAAPGLRRRIPASALDSAEVVLAADELLAAEDLPIPAEDGEAFGIEPLAQAIASAEERPGRLAEVLLAAEADPIELAASFLLAVSASKTLRNEVVAAEVDVGELASQVPSFDFEEALSEALLTAEASPSALAEALLQIRPNPQDLAEALMSAEADPAPLAHELLSAEDDPAALGGALLGARRDPRELVAELMARSSEAAPAAAALIHPDLDLSELAEALLSAEADPTVLAHAWVTVAETWGDPVAGAQEHGPTDLAAALLSAEDLPESLAGALLAAESSPAELTEALTRTASPAGRLAADLARAKADPRAAGAALLGAEEDPAAVQAFLSAQPAPQGLAEALLASSRIPDAQRLYDAAEVLVDSPGLEAAAETWAFETVQSARLLLIADATRIADSAETLVLQARETAKALRMLGDAEGDTEG